jgi:hypothetical protein
MPHEAICLAGAALATGLLVAALWLARRWERLAEIESENEMWRRAEEIRRVLEENRP